VQRTAAGVLSKTAGTVGQYAVNDRRYYWKRKVKQLEIKGHPNDGEPLFLFVFTAKIQIKILEIGRF
jgi:hypothetical protein